MREQLIKEIEQSMLMYLDNAQLEHLHQTLFRCLENVDVVYTDVWVSMVDEAEKAQREIDLKPYQVNRELMDLANDEAVFMHCLPAVRGQEVSADVIDGPQSVVYDQAENRLHAQKAVLYHYMKD